LDARLLSLGTVHTGSHYISVTQRANRDALHFAHHAGTAVVVQIDDGDDLISSRSGESNHKNQESLVTSLLQALDSSPSAVVAITTNLSLEHIEPALRTRSTALSFGEATPDARRALCGRLLNPEILAPGVSLDAIVGSSLSMREVKRACQNLVLRVVQRHLELGAPQKISVDDIDNVMARMDHSATGKCKIGFQRGALRFAPTTWRKE